MGEPAPIASGRDQDDRQQPSDDRYKWRVLGVVVFGIFMVVLDTTVVNVAFPTMREQFHASLALSQWIVSLYVLSLGITTPLAGYLSDRFGMKRMYLTGLAIFAIGSLGSGLAPGLAFLIGTRAVQGIGGGIAMPLGTAMLFAAFPPEQQGYALGLYGIALLVAPALGPILGGFLVDHNLWRWIFFINVPIGITGVILGLALLRERRDNTGITLDPWGLATSIIGFGGVLYAASMAAEAGWTAAPVLVGFGIGGVGLIAFVVVELHVADDPLLDFRLFSNIVFLNATLVGWVTVMALFGAEFLMPIYLQMERGRTAFDTGLNLLPLAVVAGIVTPIAGRLYDRIGPRPIVIVGFSVLCLNTWELSNLTGTTSILWVCCLMGMRGFAFGNTVQSTFATALGTVQRMRVARGSSLINSTRFAVQAIAVAVFATIIATTPSPRVQAEEMRVQQLPAVETRGVGICQSTRPGAGALRAIPAAARARACDETMHGFENAYRVTFWFALLALVMASLLPGWPFGWHGRASLQPARRRRARPHAAHGHA